MSCDEYRRLREPTPVEVHVDGVWQPGELRAWRRTDGVWRGFVGYNLGPGMNHVAWVESDQLRQSE